MRVESRARARALQALYAWDMRDDQPLDRVATTIWDDLAIPPLERDFAGKLIRVVIAKEQELEHLIENVTTNWRIERIGAIERSVLRLAAAELSAGETPPRVVIQEAVRLAERYGSPQSAKFVNGVVDAIARKLGRL
jgi:transcription antitermination protein NusB